MPSNEPYEQADIRVAEVMWSKASQGKEVANQKTHLMELAELAQTGLVLDCAFVEVANSELLNLLVRVRTTAKKQNKGFAIFNVPDALLKTIKLCKMETVLPIAPDMFAAKKMAYNASGNKGGLKEKLKRFLGK